MHRPLVAVRGEAVPGVVPRLPQRVQVAAHPFPDLRSSERFHWLRTLRPDKHNTRTNHRRRVRPDRSRARRRHCGHVRALWKALRRHLKP